VDLAVFRAKDSVHYLLQTIGLKDIPDTQAKVGELAEELGHLPLALSHAAHYLKLVGGEDASGDIISKYIKKFRETPIYHFEKRQNPFESGKSTINYEHLIARTFEMTREKLSDLAQQLMIYCAYLDPDQIATDIFIQANCSKEDIATALSELEAYSLIKRNRNTFSIHRLTQLVLRMEREKKENLAQVPAFFNNLLSYFYYYWSKFPMVKKEKDENFKGEKEEDFFVLYEINSILLTNLTKIDEHLRYHYKISNISRDIIATLGAGSILMQDIGHKICHYLRNKIFHKVPLIEQDRTVRGFSLKIFKEECLEKSINLTEEDYKLLFSFIPEMESERYRTKLATVLAKIEPGQRQRILKMSTDLLPQKVKVYDIYCMIKTLSKIDEADWDKITQFMRLLNPDTVRKDKEVILSFAHIIAEIDKSDHRKFVKLLKEILFSPHRHNSPISLLFETFTEIKKLQWKEFIKLLDAILFSENTNIKNVSPLLKYFLMSEPKWKTIIKAVQIFSTQTTNKDKIQVLFKYLAIEDEFMWRIMGNGGKFERGYTRSLILKIFTIIDKPFFCEKFFQIAEILSNLNMDRYHTLLSIEVIAKIEINNWSKVVLLLQTLVDKNMNGNQISLILDIIQKVNVSSWKEILKIVDPLFSLQIDKYDHKRIVNFIEFFIKIDSTNYRKMAEILSTLITQKMEIGEISHILNSLVKISPSEWESSIKRCQDLY
ncbi:MAG: hypothetical protein K0M45_03955, partial [Candidatus Paracaedibacteraceae bacterium]|nr:hypothetical protein [Candidatus Paracaedibacteraceae bacterium]